MLTRVAWMFSRVFRDDQKRNGRKCRMKVAVFILLTNSLNTKTLPKNDLKARGIQMSNKLLEEVVALTELTISP